MDLQKAIGSFFDENGDINLPPFMTLAAMAEFMYQADVAEGGGDKKRMHFWDFSESREGKLIEYTRTEIDTRVKAVAGRLQQVASIGDRAAILANNSPEYIFSFLGALYAGLVPVPLYDPTEPGHADHLNAVFADSSPVVVLTNTHSAGAVRKHFSALPAKERPRILAVDSLPDSLAESYENPMMTEAGKRLIAMRQVAPIDLTAFLQYTSGSTRTPAGVVLTNRSILTNVLQIFKAVQLQTPLRLVSWLPLHHDMGIILAAFVTMLGLDNEFMNPRDFVQQPSRWIKQMARRADETDMNVYTVVPNFALELAARYAKPAEGEELDLSNVDAVVVGSEPVTVSALQSFREVFEPYGLPTQSMRPSYGLAEASLLVATPQTENRPVVAYFDREVLKEHRVELVEKGAATAVPFVSNGQVVTPQQMVIVDPETKAELPEGQIGEIWTHGENTAAGYLDREEDTAETFRNRLLSRLEENSRATGAADDNYWMATGDLGVILDNELYITGRIKDLIVVAGRNHYPQDIEYTVQAASSHIRVDSVAAFAVPAEDIEKLIILAERDSTADPANDEAAIEAIRAAVGTAHGVVPEEIRILAADEIARSSSGKIARRVNQRNYIAEQAN
ncbi:FadD32-like long-chain-fatty-acid--AMP ligase [Corynebacterium callunae]|uniref:FadD32-like long-chain-fatty-acid--AMP ligase n=1 Tax=Corynebacterium callunae TaxID=1721 RepID=UPI00200006CF|nr:FadD32-like long-chain-fatty-acid--AMP ligase [Corynebacterium callunae]MCK2199875.1 FadD32-like long-chain-fatty-acid--AMP ligase [Corynebacterium callunae]